MKKIVFSTMIIIMLMMVFFPIISNATGILQQGKDFIQTGEDRQNSKFTFGGTLGDINGKTKDRFEELAGLFFGIGVGVCLLVTVIIGIKLMLSSAEEKSEVKKAVVPYVVGTVIIFGSLTIWKILIEVFEGAL